MTGTILNAAGILIGCVVGLCARKPLAADTQRVWKIALGALVMFVGLRLTWTSLSGGFMPGLKQIVIALFALIFGRLLGRGLRLQNLSNHLGRYAKSRIDATTSRTTHRFNDGFVVCAILFAVTPLGLVGAVQDGLTGYWPTLAVKAVMDALAAMAFVAMFGGGVVLSILPVAAVQGTISLLSGWVGAQLALPLVESINATGGLVVFSVALVIWELKKVELVDYLPSLAVAPLLTWLVA
jgi:hypothetical protein